MDIPALALAFDGEIRELTSVQRPCYPRRYSNTKASRFQTLTVQVP